MRQLFLDTETTGMNMNGRDKAKGHRIIELAMIEVIDGVRTYNDLHRYFNPERKIDFEAMCVHGISNEFVAKEPLYKVCLSEIEAYMDGADELIAHNMPFDQSFLNRELMLAGRGYKIEDRFTLVDTYALAKAKHPDEKVSLDALCQKYGIDNSARTTHGAMIDAELLLEVYRGLIDPNQPTLIPGEENY